MCFVFRLQQKSGWVSEDGDVYVIYTIKQMANDLDRSERTVKTALRELENAMHDYELPPIHYTVIRANLQQMGVAGDDSWGAQTHKEYLLDTSKHMSFTFSFKGI